MSLKPCLPQNETNLSSRTTALLLQQKIYQYTYNYEALKGVAMLNGVPEKEKPTFWWWVKVGKVLFKILQNRIDYIAEKSIFLKIFTLPFSAIKLFASLLLFKDKEKVLDALSLEFTKKKANQPQIDTSGYKDYFQKLSIPKIAYNFQDDSAFAQMRVSGLNPVVIKAHKEIDIDFPITNEIFTSVKEFENDNIEVAMEENRVFIADYVALKNIKNGTYNSVQKYSYVPKALFALKKSDQPEFLQPLAIQCEQNATEDTPIFTPNDGDAWEIAKTIVQIADLNYHELITHLSATHLLIEPFVVTTQRQLATNHPLYILLNPHFEGTAFINFSAQKRLVNDGGPFDKLFSGTMPTNRAVVGERLSQSFNDSMLEVDLKARGVEDKKLIYPYRDDALKIHVAINSWVCDYLDIYYKNDDDIIKDNELQNWVKELVTDGKVQGFGDNGSSKIETLSYLKQAITMIIFTSSAQHCAVNFTQQAYPGFTPNMPAAGYKASPKNKNLNQQDWLDLIAPLNVADDQTDLMFTLSGVYYTVLGNYPLFYFQDSRVSKPMKEFKRKLKDIEKEINKRNKDDQKSAYTFMLPSKIPQSINI